MAFPADSLPIRGELQINNAWVDITGDVRGEQNIVIAGGLAPEQTTLSPCNIAFAINNHDGRYSDDNPNSPYAGLLPVNTPFRVSVLETVPFVRMPNNINVNPIGGSWTVAMIETTDKASLDITGDIDIRIDLEPERWSMGTVGTQLASKYDTSGLGRSWLLTLTDTGFIRFFWSTDGNSALTNGTWIDSTERVPASARVALRVAFDVNDGAGGRAATFYTASTIAGPWTQLGDVVTQSGTTSIFSSGAKVQVGGIRDSGGNIPFVTSTKPRYMPLIGRVYRFQVYSGIGGTLVADMNAGARSEGDTSWSDGLASPNTWTTLGNSELTKADYRGYGEISELPAEWDPTGADIFVPTSANGITRRLTQGASALRSAIYRNLRQFINNGALGYWPLEGGSQTTAAGNAVPGQRAAQVNNVLFSTDTDIPGSAGVMTLNDADSFIHGDVSNRTAADQAFAIFYVKVPAAPGADTELFCLFTTGTIARVMVVVGSGSYKVIAYAADGSVLGTNTTGFGANGSPGRWLAFQIKLTKSGTSVNVDLGWYPLGGAVFYGMTPMVITSAVVGAPMSFHTPSGAGTMNASFAHIMIGNRANWEYANMTFARSSVAYDGELAAVRYLRVCREEGVQARILGWPEDTEVMGPQPIATLMTILDECVALDGGLHYEARDMAALIFLTRMALYAQNATVLDYEQKHLSGKFRPTNDDRLLRNDVTVQRPTGSFANVTRESGPKSILPPPDGVGRYDDSPTLNAGSDLRLPSLAGWRVGIGTWPARRVPNLEVWLQRSVFVADAALTRAMRSIDPGDRVQVVNTPDWVGGGTTDMLIRGYVEMLKNRGQELAFSSVPYGPYDAARYDYATDRVRYDVRTSVMQFDLGSADTLAQVTSISRNGFWSWTAIPYNIKMKGQINTVLGASRPDSISNVDTSFETGVSGHYVSGGSSTLTASTAQKPYGLQSALLTVAGSPGTASMGDAVGGGAIVNGVYQLIAWVRCSTTRSVGMKIDWYDGSSSLLSTSTSSAAVTANTWTQIQFTATAPASTANARPGVYLDTSPANGTLLYVKNLDILRLDVRNNRQVMALTRGVNGVTKDLHAGDEVHITSGRAWTL